MMCTISSSLMLIQTKFRFLFLHTVHYEYGRYSREGGTPSGLGLVWGTATSPPPPPPHQPPPAAASSPFQLPGIHRGCGWRERNTFTCGCASSLFCSWEWRRGKRGSSGAAGISRLLGLLGAGDRSERADRRNQRVPRWTGVRDHPDTSHRHGCVWLPLSLYSKRKENGERMNGNVWKLCELFVLFCCTAAFRRNLNSISTSACIPRRIS